MKKDFAKYDVLFSEVMRNFESKQAEFDQLKKMSKAQLTEYNNEVKIKNIPHDWRCSLEMKLPESKPGEHCHDSNLVHFNETKKAELSQIEAFMHVLHDWAEETSHEIDALAAQNEKPKWVPPKETDGCVLSTSQMIMFTGVVVLAAFGAYKIASK